MNNVQNRSKRGGTYHLKNDLQAINSILHSKQNIVSKCASLWPYIDNLCVYESLVNPEIDSKKKNSAAKLNFLNDKMKQYKILNDSKDLNWTNLTTEQSLVIYGLFVDIYFGVM